MGTKDGSEQRYMSRVRNIDWIKIYIHSFYIQAAWNYENMQALGFTATMVPVLKRICKTKEERISFLRRHLEFFNAHPYFASYLIGASARLEEIKNPDTDEAVRVVKKNLHGPLGSLGDQMFWSGLRPLAGAIGATLALQGSMWGPILFLLLYNLPHLFIRYWGLKCGYRLGAKVSQELVKPRYKKAIQAIQSIGALAVGVLISTQAVTLSRSGINRLILFLLFIILCWYALCIFVAVFGCVIALV